MTGRLTRAISARLLLLAFALPAPPAAAQSAPVPEAPARLIVTGLALPSRLATTYAWLDAHTLAVTTLPPGVEGDYAEQRRVVAVDSRTGAQRLLLDRGFLSCANPHTGVVAAYVGDLRQMLRDAQAPAPVLTWFRWQAAASRLVPSPPPPGPPMHTQQCRPFDPEDDRNGQVTTGAAPVRMLEPGHGQIRWTDAPLQGRRTDVHWARGNQRRALDVPAETLPPFVAWLPYRSAYLLSPGVYDMAPSRTIERLALTTMDLQGRIARQPAPAALAPLLSKDWESHQVFALPMRDGVLLAVRGRSHDGAGLYRQTRQGLQRLFCGRPPGWPADESLRNHEHCFQDEPIAVSPDGCTAAFVTRYDADGRLRSASLQGQVHVLDLCGKAVR